jgi:hypothetical protein
MSSQSTPKFLKNPNMPYEEAFRTNDGTPYYWFINSMGTPCLRALTAQNSYEKIRMRSSKEMQEKETTHLETWIEKLEGSLDGNTGKIRLSKAFEAIAELKKVIVYRKEREQMLVSEDLIYDFAAAVFFDEKENPYVCDMAYNQKKIEKWKKEEDTLAFFLQTPLIDLLPFLKEYEETSPTYLKNLNLILGQQLKTLHGVGGTASS